MCRVGQNRIYTPCMAVYLVISLAKNAVYTPYIYGSGKPYTCVVLVVKGGNIDSLRLASARYTGAHGGPVCTCVVLVVKGGNIDDFKISLSQVYRCTWWSCLHVCCFGG